MQTAELLTKVYLDWQANLGEPKTFAEFAEWLGISRQHLHHFITGNREPTLEVATQIARRIGTSIFITAGLVPTDPVLQFIIHNWGLLDESQKQEVVSIVVEATKTPPDRKLLPDFLIELHDGQYLVAEFKSLDYFLHEPESASHDELDL